MPTRNARLVLAGYWVVLAIATHWPRLDVTGGHNDLFRGAVQADKCFHALGFAILVWLLLRARPAGRGASRMVTALVATLIAAAYAGVDEWTQQWAARQVGISDIVASLIGVFAAAIIWLSPAHAEARGPRGLWINLSRLSWIIVAPLATALATLPNPTRFSPLRVFLGYLTEPGVGRDKLAHLILACLLTWLLAASAPAGRRRPRLGAVVTVVVMAISAPVIELVQSHTGRGFEIADIYAHQRGLLTALVGWWAWTVFMSGWGDRRRKGEVLPADPSHPEASPVSAAEGGVARASFVGHALIVGVLTLASRLTGLVRDSLLGSAFGVGGVAGAFTIGFLVPNLFRRLFGEGALSAAFIPHYTELRHRNPELARRFASLCLSLLTVVLTGIALLGEGVVWSLITYGGWDPDTHLALRLTAIMLPYMPLICLVAIIGGVLQVHGWFGAPAAAPILLNVVMTVAILWATWGMDVAQDTPQLADAAHFVAWSVLLAGVVQLLWQIGALLRVMRPTTMFAGTGPTVRSMLAMMLPMLVGLAAFQLNTFLDSLIAFFLAARPGAESFRALGWTIDYPMERGAVAALAYAQRLYQFPLGVFGIAIATAIFPALAAAAPGEGEETPADFRRILRQGLRVTMFIGLPATVGLVMLSLPATRLIYERNAFTLEDSHYVAAIVAAYASSIWAYSMTHVLTRAFYALKDARTPLRVSLWMIAANFSLNVTLIWFLGVVGLAVSSAITAVGQVVLLLLAIRKRVPQPIDRYVLNGWGRTAGLSAVMALALGACLLTVDVSSTDTSRTAAVLGGLILLGMAIMLGGAWLTGAEELDVLRRARRRR